MGLKAREFGIVTLHRPSNVDDTVQISNIIDVLMGASEKLPLLFPVHPRTRIKIEEAGLLEKVSNSRVKLIDPLGYIQFMNLVFESKLVINVSILVFILAIESFCFASNVLISSYLLLIEIVESETYLLAS